jgi:tRNA 2-thiocytidine biosynthesis protein TtcA
MSIPQIKPTFFRPHPQSFTIRSAGFVVLGLLQETFLPDEPVFMKRIPQIPARLNKKIGQAMHDYSMFEDGDRVLVALSGGVDSLVLVCLLQLWQKKAPITFDLQALHIDHGFWKNQEDGRSPLVTIGTQLGRYSIEMLVEEEWQEEQERSCYLCSRNRRSQLFDFAKDHGYNKIAFGHHKDDLIETFMINAIYSGNISTMLPKQELFKQTLSLIRPMCYLEKTDVVELAGVFDLYPVENGCPLSANTRREKVRSLLANLYATENGAKSSLFAALSNVRTDYLL